MDIKSMFGFDIKPNFEHLKDVILRKKINCKIPMIEAVNDAIVYETIVGKKFIRETKDAWIYFPKVKKREELEKIKYNLNIYMNFWLNMGYDYIEYSFYAPYQLPKDIGDKTTIRESTRSWTTSIVNRKIKNMDDLEFYPWPKKEDLNLFPLEYIAKNIHEGMKIIVSVAGPMEIVRCIMDLDLFFIACVENPEFVKTLINKCIEYNTWAIEAVLSYNQIGAIWLFDDIAYNASTVVSPKNLREYFFPFYKKISHMIKSKNIPFLFHSCGNLENIMNDLIFDIKIDARHGFQDIIMPIESAYDLYKNKITLLGGLDMDFIVRQSPEMVKVRTRKILNTCGYDGSYCFGTGNSISDYIPLNNYLAMVEEWLLWNKENFGA